MSEASQSNSDGLRRAAWRAFRDRDGRQPTVECGQQRLQNSGLRPLDLAEVRARAFRLRRLASEHAV